MNIRSTVVSLVGFVAVVFSLVLPAYAGKVKVVVSDNWSNIPRVEVRWGLNDEYGPKRWSNVKPGKVLGTFTDQACYRRSRDPGNANSGLSNWTCMTHVISGTETLRVD